MIIDTPEYNFTVKKTIFDYIFSKLTGGVYTHQKYLNFQFDSYMTWVGGLSINCH